MPLYGHSQYGFVKFITRTITICGRVDRQSGSSLYVVNKFVYGKGVVGLVLNDVGAKRRLVQVTFIRESPSAEIREGNHEGCNTRVHAKCVRWRLGRIRYSRVEVGQVGGRQAGRLHIGWGLTYSVGFRNVLVTSEEPTAETGTSTWQGR